MNTFGAQTVLWGTQSAAVNSQVYLGILFYSSGEYSDA